MIDNMTDKTDTTEKFKIIESSKCYKLLSEAKITSPIEMLNLCKNLQSELNDEYLNYDIDLLIDFIIIEFNKLKESLDDVYSCCIEKYIGHYTHYRGILKTKIISQKRKKDLKDKAAKVTSYYMDK